VNGERGQNYRARGGYITTSCWINQDYGNSSGRDKCLEGCRMLSIQFLSFHKDFGDGIQSTEGVMLRG
jgi:hypothetical protein